MVLTMREAALLAASIVMAASGCAGAVPVAQGGTSDGIAATDAAYAWIDEYHGGTIMSRIPPPEGYSRITVEAGGFGEWLRGLPLRPGRPPVRLYDGGEKSNQSAHHAVVAIDVGTKNLQQCADAIIRLRAEYLYACGAQDAIAFHFTSGDLAEWSRWRDGQRPVVDGREVSWIASARPDAGYDNFRKYLESVFTYAGTASLSRELVRVGDPTTVRIGDVFIEGGFPGHALLVVDVAADGSGHRVFLLAQSYMPAQEIHVLRNPRSAESPWYPALREGALVTPEWMTRYESLRRFPGVDCAPEAASFGAP